MVFLRKCLNHKVEREVILVVEVRKREKESSEGLLRRFSRKVQQSGLLLKARKVRFREPEKNGTQLRKDALRRLEIQKERDFLRKTGKLV